MVEHNNSSRYNHNKGKRKHYDNTKAYPNKKSKVTCWKCGKPEHLKKDCKGGKVDNKANGSGTNGSVDGFTNSLKGHNMFNKSFQAYYVTYVSEAYYVQDDDVAWWVDLGATVHVYKDRCWFRTYESLNDGFILHMGNESTSLVHGRGCVDLRFSSENMLNIENPVRVRYGDCCTTGCVGVITLGMERGFLSQRESGVRRGVKEKQVSMANKSVEVRKHVNVALGSNSATPNDVNTGLKAFITISEAHGIHSHASANEENINDVGIINNVANNGTTMGPNPADNTPGMSTSYVNVTGEPSRKALNFCTLFTSAGNGVDVVVSVESIKAISERFANMAYGFFFGKADGLPRSLIKIRADVELKDNIMVVMPKLVGESFYTCNIRVENEWKPPSENKKKDVEPIKEVSNSNLFDVLNSIENDVDLSTNGGTLNLASKEANPSESLFWNVETSSTSTTHIVNKIDKFEKLVIDGKVSLVNDEGKPLKKVDYPDGHGIEDEVESVDNDMACFMDSVRVGYGTNSLLKQ
ncbi:zinc finger, CCHC-type containing protein [Tanacetum coccineum]